MLMKPSYLLKRVCFFPLGANKIHMKWNTAFLKYAKSLQPCFAHWCEISRKFLSLFFLSNFLQSFCFFFIHSFFSKPYGTRNRQRPTAAQQSATATTWQGTRTVTGRRKTCSSSSTI